MMKNRILLFSLFCICIFGHMSCDENDITPELPTVVIIGQDTTIVGSNGEDGEDVTSEITINGITITGANDSINDLIGFNLIGVNASSCEDTIEGEGEITSEIWTPEPFTGIEFHIPSEVIISQGDEHKVTVTGHPNILEKLSQKTEDQILELSLEQGCYQDFELKVEIVMPDLNYVALTTSRGAIINPFQNQSDELTIKLIGSGKLELHQFEGLKTLNIEQTGSGRIEAVDDFPNLVDLDIQSLGSGLIYLFLIQAQNCTINSLGSGNCNVYASANLSVTILGSRSVNYKGEPNITENITGSGKLINAN